MDKELLLKGIGLKIRELRNEGNLTIQEFADKLDMEYNNVIRFEKGRANLTIGTLLKICEALNVKVVDVVNVY